MKGRLIFLTELARCLHQSGAASYHIEDALKSVSEKICNGGEFFVTPTQIYCAIETAPEQVETRLLRVFPSGIRLDKLAAADKLADDVTEGRCSVEDGLVQLRQMAQQPDPAWVRFMPLAFGLSSGLFCSLLGGGIIDMLVSAGFSLIIFGFTKLQGRFQLGSMAEFFGAFVVTLLAHGIAPYLPQLKVDITVLASLIVLLPGLSITVALAELSIKHLMSGSARLMGSFIELLKMSLGVFLGTSLASRWFDPTQPMAQALGDPVLPAWLVLLACSICFGLLFYSRLKDLPFVVLVSFISFFCARWGSLYLGHEMGAFCGGLAVGVASNTYARLLQRPALTVLLPALLPLVPGSVGYKSLSFLFAMEVVDAMSNAFSMIVVAIALVTGMSFGHILVHPRRSI